MSRIFILSITCFFSSMIVSENGTTIIKEELEKRVFCFKSYIKKNGISKERIGTLYLHSATTKKNIKTLIFVTCFHVFESTMSFRITTPSEKYDFHSHSYRNRHEKIYFYALPKKDLLFLKIIVDTKRNPHLFSQVINILPPKISFAESHHKKVAVLGFHGRKTTNPIFFIGQNLQVAIIENFKIDSLNMEPYQISATNFTSGMSGMPCIDISNGHVIGIVFAKIKNDHWALVIPYQQIQSIMEDSEIIFYNFSQKEDKNKRLLSSVSVHQNYPKIETITAETNMQKVDEIKFWITSISFVFESDQEKYNKLHLSIEKYFDEWKLRTNFNSKIEKVKKLALESEDIEQLKKFLELFNRYIEYQEKVNKENHLEFYNKRKEILSELEKISFSKYDK